ncbi:MULTISPECIES: HNH endonuclease signature motif containing protein [unclassified Spirulina]|uniref:HNH endonuclease signature motif containing protein n=1 Tax=unclassified Spirulina TaxID=2684457 RepID=UPI001950A006|nr:MULTISPECIES: HNH endonuclease signature motif containing protein [Spirulina]MEA5469504.1 HNH endonuclease signature motif containing protein [Spirulina sp. 06S082]
MKQIPSHPEYTLTKDGAVFNKNGKQLKVNRKGSVRVSVNRKMRLLSELLAETYLEMPANQNYSVIYLDGDCQNIGLDNLMWVDKDYSQIQDTSILLDGLEFQHITCIETHQYYISSSGLIFNFAKQKFVKTCCDSIGYKRFAYYFWESDKLVKRTIAVHILVYRIFKGNYDNAKFEINHIDGNKINNHISNLEVVDHTENVNHAVRKGFKATKYNQKHIDKIVQMLKSGYSWTDIFELYLKPELGLRKIQAFSFINGISNNKDAFVEKCNNAGFVKGSTTKAKRLYTVS